MTDESSGQEYCACPSGSDPITGECNTGTPIEQQTDQQLQCESSGGVYDASSNSCSCPEGTSLRTPPGDCFADSGSGGGGGGGSGGSSSSVLASITGQGAKTVGQGTVIVIALVATAGLGLYAIFG